MLTARESVTGRGGSRRPGLFSSRQAHAIPREFPSFIPARLAVVGINGFLA